MIELNAGSACKVPTAGKVTRDILLRSYNYCCNRLDGCCSYLMEEEDESGTEYKCTYYGNSRCKNGMLDDAIEFLKKQEPKVLTLEEVEERMNTNDDSDSIFYAEVRTLTRTSFGVFQLTFDSEDYYVATLLGSSFPAWYRKESYGHRWRCWSAKPTNKQRQETKWE